MPLARRWRAGLDALVLGDATAASLGLPRARFALVVLMALATGRRWRRWAGGLVGLVAPHLVRRSTPAVGCWRLRGWRRRVAAGGDVPTRSLLAPPMELPVGVLTRCFGGSYL